MVLTSLFFINLNLQQFINKLNLKIANVILAVVIKLKTGLFNCVFEVSVNKKKYKKIESLNY